jgi:hypothetical protein
LPLIKKIYNSKKALKDNKAHCGILQMINETNAAIDQMVYALYNLTEEEIKIVEETN